MLYQVLLLSLGLTGSLAQYRNRYIYSDYQCTNLIAVKSEPLRLGEEDNKDEQYQDGSVDAATQAYQKCLQEIQPEEAVDGSTSGVIEDVCEYLEDEEGFGGEMIYGREGCSWEVETVDAEDRVMIAQYERGCPQNGGEVVEYTSMPQMCFPYPIAQEENKQEQHKLRRAILGNNNNNNHDEDKDEENKEDEEERVVVYSYYALSCSETNALTTMQCKYSNCTGCIMTKTYVEDECYNVPNYFDNEKMYAQFWCNHTVVASATEGDDESQQNMIELPKSTVIAVASVGGALILGLGAAVANKYTGGSKDELASLNNGDYEPLNS